MERRGRIRLPRFKGKKCQKVTVTLNWLQWSGNFSGRRRRNPVFVTAQAGTLQACFVWARSPGSVQSILGNPAGPPCGPPCPERVTKATPPPGIVHLAWKSSGAVRGAGFGVIFKGIPRKLWAERAAWLINIPSLHSQVLWEGSLQILYSWAAVAKEINLLLVITHWQAFRCKNVSNLSLFSRFS